MLLWTVMPLELVWEETSQPPAYEETDIDGTKMLVERMSTDQCRIVRLLSTNPEDYLRTEIQPGTLLNYKPMLEVNC